MKCRTVLIICGCVSLLALAVAQMSSRKSVGAELETKVSEKREKGKYVRTTETFSGRSLLSLKREVSLKDDGQIDCVFIKLYREGQMIFSSSDMRREKQYIRGYYHNDKLLMQEGDTDGDGTFEKIILFDKDEQPVEGFLKTADGSVSQLDVRAYAEFNKRLNKIPIPTRKGTARSSE